jgi:hypothetical protein
MQRPRRFEYGGVSGLSQGETDEFLSTLPTITVLGHFLNLYCISSQRPYILNF